MPFSAMIAAGRGLAATSPMDWANLWLGIVGILLTIVGFALAFIQLKKTKSAAESAAAAVKVGTVRIRYNQLLVLAPQLQTVEAELDTAIQEDDRYGTGKILVRWRHLAATVHGVLTQMGPEYNNLVEAIEVARANAIVTKGKLSESRNAERAVPSIAASVQREISGVNDTLGSIVGRLATEMPDDKAVS